MARKVVNVGKGKQCAFCSKPVEVATLRGSFIVCIDCHLKHRPLR